MSDRYGQDKMREQYICRPSLIKKEGSTFNKMEPFGNRNQGVFEFLVDGNELLESSAGLAHCWPRHTGGSTNVVELKTTVVMAHVDAPFLKEGVIPAHQRCYGFFNVAHRRSFNKVP